MNDDQQKIQTMILELIAAMQRYPYNPSEIEEITSALPGIVEGTFFNRSFDKQDGLAWVSGAFFGRGERAMLLFVSGVLREEFDMEFYTLLQRYWRSQRPPPPPPPSIESQRASRKLSESLEKAEIIKKANKMLR